MKRRSLVLLLTIFLSIPFLTIIIQAQDPPPINNLPDQVNPGTSVFINTANNATCHWSSGPNGPNGSTSDPNGVIELPVDSNTPPGTIISVYCQLNGQTSPTEFIMVVDPNAGTTGTDNENQNQDNQDNNQNNNNQNNNVEVTVVTTSVSGFLCAPNVNVAVYVDSSETSAQYSFLRPAYEQRDVIAQRDTNGDGSADWYQIAPDGFWVRADQVLRDSAQCVDVSDTDWDIPHEPEIIDLVEEQFALLGCEGLTDDVLNNFTDDQIVVFIYNTQACDYFTAAYEQLQDPPEGWITQPSRQALFTECRESAFVVATFIDIMDGLTEPTQAEMRRLLSSDAVDPCQFANTLVTQQRMIGLDDSYSLSAALEPLVAACMPNYSSERMRSTVFNMRAVLDVTMEELTDAQELIGGVDEPCVLVEALMSLGGISVEEQNLFNALLECERINKDNALELLTYSNGMGLSPVDIVNSFADNENYCDDILAHFNDHPIDPDDLTADEIRHIGQIAAQTEACMTDEDGVLDINGYVALVMMAWDHWDELEYIQQVTLLMADDPCLAIRNFILNGIIPSAPVAIITSPPTIPESTTFFSEVLGEQDFAEELDEVRALLRILNEVPALGVFLAERDGIVELYSVIEGDDTVHLSNPVDRFAQPAVDPSGRILAYIDLQENQLLTYDLTAPGSEPQVILSENELALEGLQLVDYPMSWAPINAPSNNQRSLLVTFLQTGDDETPDQYVIYRVNIADELLPLGERPLATNAVSPSYAMSGTAFAYTEINPETNESVIISVGIASGSRGEAMAMQLPQGISNCFSPAYNIGDVELEWFTLYYTCLVDGELHYYRDITTIAEPERLYLETDTQSLAGMERLVPGPASDSIAFDYDGVIYLTILEDNDDPDVLENNRTTDVLFQLETFTLRDLSWARNQ